MIDKKIIRLILLRYDYPVPGAPVYLKLGTLSALIFG
jgi:hypothetical protein